MEVGSFFEFYGVANNKEKIGDIKNVCELLNIQMTRRNKARCFQHLNKISLTILFSKLVLLLLFTFFLVSASASSNNFPGLVRFKNGTIGMFAKKEILIHGEVHVGGDVYVSGNQNSMMFMFKTSSTGSHL